ncbi:MAG TPA: peptidyl-prolyl cis-trans isomerase [Pseudomonadales bacterium]|nr:peptidyl-prolyl cis-trans isomerase [Pseudomonadales bacterium]
MHWLDRVNKPWLHFIVLGVIFYQLQSALFPEPRVVIGPLSEIRIATLKKQWLTSTGRQPSTDQIARYIAVELDRDMLLQRAIDLDFHLHDSIVYQRLIRNMKFIQLAESKSDVELFDQAIEMRMHLDDEVVKRRLIQMMEQRLLANAPPTKPSFKEIEAAFVERKEELQHPPLYSIEHVFFASGREQDTASVIATITRQDLDIQAARKLGAPFLQGHQFLRQTPGQLARNFGKNFVIGLEQALKKSEIAASGDSGWLGPIRSAYGLHYVWLSQYEPARDAELQEVEQQLLVDLAYTANKQALQCAIAALRVEFDVRGKALKEPDEGVSCE